MELDSLYSLANNEKIDVVNYKWKNVKARIFEVDNSYSIAIDYSKIESSVEEKQIIAEELGHYYYNALYYISSDVILKNKCEYKSKKWAYNVLVPFDRLRKAILNGYTTYYELAEYFEVPEEFLKNAVEFYISKYGNFIGTKI